MLNLETAHPETVQQSGKQRNITKRRMTFHPMRHICSWQHQFLQEEDGHRRSYLWSFLAIWAKTLLLSGLPNWTY
ncbi:hypothetical protein LEMLEM_LOCUS3734, partial [Lemmus lemmus]